MPARRLHDPPGLDLLDLAGTQIFQALDLGLDVVGLDVEMHAARMIDLLEITTAHAMRYLESVKTRPVATTASPQQLRGRLARPLPEAPMDSRQVIDDLVRDTEDGILGSTNGRFFGWVNGGTLPAALAADWLTSVWDQNAASNLTAPAEAV